jgi:hypothetical protein
MLHIVQTLSILTGILPRGWSWEPRGWYFL